MPFILSAVLGALSLSLLSTWIVDRFLVDRISVMGTFIGLERTLNDGIAFGIDLPSWLLVLLIPMAVGFVCVLAYRSRSDRLQSIATGMILGGALGNIIDRIGDGHVTDFIQIGWWPLFNIADSCITMGVALLLLHEVAGKRKT